MMYLYQTLPDETEIVHSHLIIDEISFFEQFLHENEQELYELACKKPHKKGKERK